MRITRSVVAQFFGRLCVSLGQFLTFLARSPVVCTTCSVVRILRLVVCITRSVVSISRSVVRITWSVVCQLLGQLCALSRSI